MLFYEHLEPTTGERALRRMAVTDIAGVVKTLWPTATVTVVGSFSTGLDVPWSDVDAVVDVADVDPQVCARVCVCVCVRALVWSCVS